MHAKSIHLINIIVIYEFYHSIMLACVVVFTQLIITLTLHHYALKVVHPPFKCDFGSPSL